LVSIGSTTVREYGVVQLRLQVPSNLAVHLVGRPGQ
jgi:hypothetical protein